MKMTLEQLNAERGRIEAVRACLVKWPQTAQERISITEESLALQLIRIAGGEGKEILVTEDAAQLNVLRATLGEPLQKALKIVDAERERITKLCNRATAIEQTRFDNLEFRRLFNRAIRTAEISPRSQSDLLRLAPSEADKAAVLRLAAAISDFKLSGTPIKVELLSEEPEKSPVEIDV